MKHIEPCPVIVFDERPALDHATASEQLEHLYIHVGLAQEKINEIITALNASDRDANQEEP